MIKAIGIGDVRIDLPNGNGETKTLLKETLHAPDMAFMLISVSRLDHANCSVTFKGGICTIKNSTGRTMATVPQSTGLYWLPLLMDMPDVDHANIALIKININEAHQTVVIKGENSYPKSSYPIRMNEGQ